MSINVWLDRSDQLVVGAEIYHSHRRFQWWDYSPSNSQLLLRCDGGREWTRIDVLFKAVLVTKIRDNYNGLHIRCATTSERDQIQTENPGITYTDPQANEFDLGCRYFILDDGSGGLDYVVAQSIGWHEGYETREATNGDLGTRYRQIFVVVGPAFGRGPHVYGTYLNRVEAEHSREQLAARYPGAPFTIEAAPVGI